MRLRPFPTLLLRTISGADTSSAQIQKQLGQLRPEICGAAGAAEAHHFKKMASNDRNEEQ